MAKLKWHKYLTREYSFLYISYAIDCYKIMKRAVGTTISYDISTGDGELVSLYGIKNDIQNSYKLIDKIAIKGDKQITNKMDHYDALVKLNYELFEKIKKCEEISILRNLLIQLDKIFLETLCYYLFFVYLGYAGDLPHIKSFLGRYGRRFHKIRLYTIDVDMNKIFPKLFGKYDKKLITLAPYMWRGELIRFIQGKKVDIRKIKNRKKRYLVITKAGKTKEYSLPQIDEVLTKEMSSLPLSRSINTVNGKAACLGKVRGKVVVVFTSKDYNRIKKGNILVTPMTKPEITPYLSSVTGIVTNDGGALSHASIISREMNIPCLVGTQIATDIFKNGDEVELDVFNNKVSKIHPTN